MPVFRMSFAVLAACLAAMPVPSPAQGPREDTQQALDRLDAFVRGVAAADRFSGVVLVAKDGVVALTRALAIEYAAEGIRCNAVCPGYVDTPINDELLVGHPDPEGMKRRAAELHPPKRIGRPEEIAAAVLFLASTEASFVNGACLIVDGGRSLLYHD